jgi:hypothetical protein
MRQQSIEIISVESDVHLPERHFFATGFLDYRTQSSSEEKAAGADTNKSERIEGFILTENCPGHALET